MIDVLLAFLASLAFDLGRYGVVSVAGFFIFWRWLGPSLRARWLRPSPPDRASMRREILASIRTAAIFGVVGCIELTGTKAGIFRVYEDVSLHGGLAYALVTPLILIVLQDAYFYVTHRAMHHRLLFKAVHLEHHLSRHTSPFTAYAFSPIEALVHAAFVPLVTLVLPAHPIALFVFLLFMIVRNVLGHVGIEVYPAGFVTGPLAALSTTTTHHALHHLRPNTNFGLYFPHWDRIFGTTDGQYETRFRAVTEGDRTDVRETSALGVRSP